MSELKDDMRSIFEAVQRRDLQALKKCVAQNPKVMGEMNEEGVPAIHLAAATGDLELMKYIIEYSIVNPCLLDKQGNTILHYGVKSGNLELVKYLAERVDIAVDQANLLGVAAYDLVNRAGLKQIYEFFREALGASLEELYHNPIRKGMHPDPSIVRVGEDYYMVNSSFMFFPCIPVSHSRDLLHWEVIGHAITNPDWAGLKGLEGGRGYWAPDISYYEGRFYVTATYRLNDGGEKLRYQMVTSAEKPEGPYTEPVFLDEDGIDPSIFTDVDGRRYMLLNRGARIFEISRDGREILSQPQLLWYGHNKKASEGPHLLYKDGYYYLFMAEGGTGAGHRISVARSKTLMGPYESCPYNPILRQWDEERQLQCCGHGKPVQTPEGDWYIVYLCMRTGTAGYGMLGRETAMDPLTWTADGWPIVNSLKGPSDLQRKPKCGTWAEAAVGPETALGSGQSANPWRQWSTVRGAIPGSYEIDNTADGQRIIIHGNGLDLNTLDYGTVLVQPQQDFSFEMGCRVKIQEQSADTAEKAATVEEMSGAESGIAATAVCADGDWDAGLTCYYDENSYLKLALARREEQLGVLVAEYVGDGYVREEFIPGIFWTQKMEALENRRGLSVQSACGGEGARWPDIEFRIVTEDLRRSCYYRLCQWDDWNLAAVLEDTSYLSSEGLKKGKRFTGAMAGVYVHGRVTAEFENYWM